ncbi:MAG: ABC transporter permease [Verrucomicrobiales bacterium]|nr:ABC transporter permease [Verrucomicrobiales bacterium]
MNWFHKLRLRFRALFHKEKLDARMDDEMRSHIEMQTQENIDAGMKPEEARYAALREFGWVESIKDTCREQRGVSWLENLTQDVRYGARMLRKNPGFTAVAVLTLALGIGANTAIFSVVNAVLLRPLPYPKSDRLVWLSESAPNFPVMSISYPNFTDWRTQQTIFEHVGVYNWATFNLTGEADPLRLRGSRISAEAFAALRVQPVVGRTFRDDEDQAGSPPVLLLSHKLWSSRFGGAPDIVNRSITLDGRTCTVIGVMPADFMFPSEVDIWIPVGQMANEPSYQGRGNRPGLMGIARLKPGVTLQQARAEMQTIASRLEIRYPDSNKNCGVRIDTLIENRVGSTARLALWTILGAVGMVLLIACGNVANLLLARAAARQKEMAVRAALGAGRWRIIRQLLTESSLLALAGGVLGFVLARGGLGLILAMSGDALPRSNEVRLDSGILIFTAAVALLTGILFGLAPAVQASRLDAQEALKETSRGVTSGQARLRHALVVGEVALTLMLLIGAGLMLRTFHRLQTLDPGFSHQRVLTFRLDLPERKYATCDSQINFYRNMVEQLGALPGVQHVGIANQFPLAPDGWQTGFLVEGQPEPPPGQRPVMELTPVSPDYFQAMGIRLLRGRYFTDSDNREHLQGQDLSKLSEWQRRIMGINAIIVDEEFARRHWPNEDPIGKRVLLPPALTVVGVVSRVKLKGLDEQGGFVQAYLPLWQWGGTERVVVMKTTLAPETLGSAVRQQMKSLDPELPIYNLRTLATVRHDSLAPQRLNLSLLGLFAGAALTLAVIGLYGVLAYAVAQRRREIGIRMALGAQRGDVLALVIRHGARLTLIGVVLGLAGAFSLTRLLTRLLYEVKPTDPLTLLVTPLLLMSVALFACWLPARRAAKVDPMVALRYE